ncbi:TPA: hypothetical protein MD982_003804 [Klebsiella pneumoniae]|nr:hypothetical protein [Klebsiella pneumoniae]
MSRQGTLDLLQEVEECLETMKKSQQIKPVKVKSILENLRSSLEYVANDSYDKYVGANSTTVRPKIYFPYGEQKFVDNFFLKTLNIKKPSSEPLYKTFNSIQDYHTGKNWLKMMCNLTNEVKHRQPIPLKEDSFVKDISVSVDGFSLIQADGSSNFVFENNYVNGKKIQDFSLKNGNLEVSGKGVPLNIVITEEKKIKFHGNNYEVIPFIESCIINIRNFIVEAYDELEK